MCPQQKPEEKLTADAFLETAENVENPACFSNYQIGTKYHYDYKMNLAGKGGNKQKKQTEVLTVSSQCTVAHN